MSLRWHFDEFNARCITGWIDDDGPVTITISVNNRIVGTGPANKFREDLVRAGIGDGRRAFSFPISRFLLQPSNIVSVSRDDKVLQSATLQPVSEDARIAAILRVANIEKPPSDEILFLQTCDPQNYRHMLQLTSRTVIEYCGRHNLNYQSYIGICRGDKSWHAAFNRIVLLRRILNAGFFGWACYLDADSFIVDLDFDIKRYLTDKEKIALVIATDQPHVPDRPYWAINNGVFFINLGNHIGRQIIWDWADRFDAVSDERLYQAKEWSFDDQGLLGELLKSINPANIMVLRDQPSLINYDQGQFIRQILRAVPFAARMDLIRQQTDLVLSRPAQPACMPK